MNYLDVAFPGRSFTPPATQQAGLFAPDEAIPSQVPGQVVPFDQVARVREALGPEGPGWIVIRSRTLGRLVLWARDGSVALPERANGLTRFTLAELDQLVDGGATPEDLRDLDRVKKMAPGSSVEAFARLLPFGAKP